MQSSKIILADIASHNYSGKSIGHYFSLCRNYMTMFPGCMIAGGPIYKEHFPQDQLIILPFDTLENEGVWLSKWHEFKNIRKLYKNSEGKTIVLQQSALATAIIFIALLRKPNCKLFLIAYDNAIVRTRFKRFFYRLAKKKIDGIICPNEDIGRAFGISFCVVPDYIYTGDNCVDGGDYNKKVYDFCMVGRLSPEKGAVEVVRKLRGTPYKVIIAGSPQNEKICEELRSEARGYENIELLLRYIEEDEYNRIMVSSRYAFLNYQGEYSVRSSGVVYDMLFKGVPIVGCKCKALEFIANNNCGFLYDKIDDFNPIAVLQEARYMDYVHNIKQYRELHKKEYLKLCDYLYFENYRGSRI